MSSEDSEKQSSKISDFFSYCYRSAQGYVGFSLPEALIFHRLNFPTKVIDVSDYSIIFPEGKLIFLDEYRKKKQTKLADSPDYYLPEGYKECSQCAYDHTYDHLAAARWHESHQ